MGNNFRVALSINVHKIFYSVFINKNINIIEKISAKKSI